jgi:hypothetical protein
VHRLAANQAPREAQGTPAHDFCVGEASSKRTSRAHHVVRHCRNYVGVNCIPLLTCQLRQGLPAHGEHFTRRCQGWTEDMVRQRGWAPEVA